MCAMNIASLLSKSATSFGSRPAVSIGPVTHATYSELASRVSSMAANLRGRYRLQPGDTIGITLTNCPQYFEVLFAIWHAGLTAVPINAKLHQREFHYILSNSGAKMCFVTPDLEEAVAPLVEELPALETVICTGSKDYQGMLHGATLDMEPVNPSAPAWIFYTSGTTGRPKGAVLTHRNLLVMTLSYFADIDQIGPQDSVIHPAPLSHASGCYSLPHFAKGANNVIPESGHFDPPEIFQLISQNPGVSFFAAPTMVTRLLQSREIETADTANLKAIIYGGGPMYVADLQRALSRFGPKLVQIYGQGEAPMTITALWKSHHAESSHPRYEARLGSTGIARTDVEVRVIDGEDNPLPPGMPGEVAVRGDVVMAGYWNNPQATAETLRGGWLHTGDVGVMDEEGFLTLKDRLHDMIISGGTNIYPREIEEVLLQHRSVLEASVVGRPHPDWGEEVIAFVVPRNNAQIDEDELDRLCLDNIARFKRPKAYFLVEELPKNNYGKILKRELRERLVEKETGQPGI